MDSRWLKKSAAANEILSYEPYVPLRDLVPRPPSPKLIKQDLKPVIVASGSMSAPIEISDSEEGEEYNVIPMPTYCVQRKTPLVYPNQELVGQLAVIKQARWLNQEEISTLAYARAIAVCHSCRISTSRSADLV